MITYKLRRFWWICLMCATLPSSIISILSGVSSIPPGPLSSINTSLEPTCEPAVHPKVLAMPNLKPSGGLSATASIFCPKGWILHKITCYKSLASAVTVRDCKDLCSKKKSRLPCIQDEDQNAYLAQFSNAAQPSSSLWIDSEWSSGCVSSFNGVTADQFYPEGDLTVNSDGRWLNGQGLQQCVCLKDATISPPNSNIIVFDYTGEAQEYIIPEGLLALKVTLYGASGGPSTTLPFMSGKGAIITSTIANPIAGSVMYIYVGGKGLTGINAGGFNGGGASTCAHSGSGGGATEVRYLTKNLVDRVVMIAGGGSGAAGRQLCVINDRVGQESSEDNIDNGGCHEVCIGGTGGFTNGGSDRVSSVGGGAGGDKESIGSSWSLYDSEETTIDKGNTGNGYGIFHLIHRTSIAKHSAERHTTDTGVMDNAQSSYLSQQESTPELTIPSFSFGWLSSMVDYPVVDPTSMPSPPKSTPPSLVPTVVPSQAPTTSPTHHPTLAPTQHPSAGPTIHPTADPTVEPSMQPSAAPTAELTLEPTLHPSVGPTIRPTADPSVGPTIGPTAEPSMQPSAAPTAEPTLEPTQHPSVGPTIRPTADPSVGPTTGPTAEPSIQPTAAPTAVPTLEPTQHPSSGPTIHPTTDPTIEPSMQPSAAPTVEPTLEPTQHPSSGPTIRPSADSTVEPSMQPSATPTAEPTLEPTLHPSAGPTIRPSADSTVEPSIQPSAAPTAEPTLEPTLHPSGGPTIRPTTDPTIEPSIQPSAAPTAEPTLEPTQHPSAGPTTGPTVEPSIQPSAAPSVEPSIMPSHAPSMEPTVAPTAEPTVGPTRLPSIWPTDRPTLQPTFAPTYELTPLPSNTPTVSPSLNGWIRSELNATEYVGSFDDNGAVWTYILNNGTVSQLLRSDSADDTFTARFQDAFWTSITSVSRTEPDGQLVISGSRRVGHSVLDSVAHCRIDTDSLVCSVKSFPDVTILAESLISFTNQDVYFGHSFGQVTATVFSKNFAERSYTYESNFMKSWQFTHISSPAKFAGSFVSGSAVGKDGRNYLIMGYFRADDGSLQPTYLKPTNRDILLTAELVNTMASDPLSADLFVGGGLSLSGGSVAVNAYLVRVNALYRTFLYGVRYVSTVGERRVLRAVSSVSGSLSVIQSVQLVDQTLFILLNTNHTALTGQVAFTTIIEAHASTGAIIKQVSFAAHNASARCTNLGTPTNSLIVACSCLTQQTESVGEALKRSFLLSIDRNLTLSALPTGFYLYGSDLFRTEIVPFKATYFPATSKQATFRTIESTGDGTSAPASAPTLHPTPPPSTRPSVQPSSAPSSSPNSSPTAAPSVSPQPTSDPSTGGPTNTYKPTVKPTLRPSAAPSKAPSRTPTRSPTTAPTSPPTAHPSLRPSALPSAEPTIFPTRAPTVKSTRTPSTLSTPKPSSAPSAPPTLSPTLVPTLKEQIAAGQTLAGSIVAYILGSLAFLWGALWLFRFCLRARERHRIKAETKLAFASLRQAVRDRPPRSVQPATQRLYGISEAVPVAGAPVYDTRSAATSDRDSANGTAELPSRGAYLDSAPPPAVVVDAAACSSQPDKSLPDSSLLQSSDSSDIYSVSSLHSSEMSDIASHDSSTGIPHSRSGKNEVEEGGVT